MVKDEAFYRTKRNRFILTILLGFVSFFVLVPFLTYFYFAPDLSSKETIMNRNDNGVILLDRNEKPFFSFYQAKFKSFVPLSDVSPYIQQAVVAVEDKDFYEHPGFSIRSIIRAFIANFTEKDIRQGGSTITQQLVKNALLNPKKSYARKYQELVLAQEIERKYSKKEILEMYLNSVYFGEGAFGVGQAAEVYFGKVPKDLTLAESAMLAGLLPSPSTFSPINGDLEMAKDRQQLVLRNMLELEYINREKFEQALKEEIKYNTTNESINTIAPHYALMVRDELIKNFGEEQIQRSGFKVKTSIDLEWQEYAEGVVEAQVDKLARNRVTNGAAVVIDPKTGEIRVLVGSKDWYNEEFGKFNMALAPRQPGSSFKPIVYADALEKRKITAGTVLHDKPTTFAGNYKPQNYDRKTRGDVLLRRALALSLNIPAVEVMNMLGVEEVLDFSQDLGITTLKEPVNYGLSLVLGSGEIPLVEMTNTYAVLANGGKKNNPTIILEIKDKHNEVIFSENPTPKQTMDPGVAYIISVILADDAAKRETFGNALTNRYNAAVKTGTTEDYKDALTLGYMPNLAVGVWVGNNDRTAMDQVAGSLGPAPIWRILMEHYLAELPREQFVRPSNVVSMSVCSYRTEKEEKDKNKEKVTVTSITENFLLGTEPSNACNPSPTVDPSASPSVSPTTSPPTNPPNTPFPTPTKAGETPTLTPVLPTVQVTVSVTSPSPAP